MATDGYPPALQPKPVKLSRKTVIKARFVDQVKFLGTVIRAPRAVGAIAPTHQETARLIASNIDTASGLPVLELGPGTGAITEAIFNTGLPADRLYAIEYSAPFCRHLQEKFPGAHFLQGDAFNFQAALDAAFKTDAPNRFDCVISGLPLLNFPKEKRFELFNAAMDAVAPGRPFVQFSYGILPPVPVDEREFAVTRSSWIFRNLPPARVWVYRRKI